MAARTRDPEAKKLQLLLAALAEFAEHGGAGARIDRIAKRAGVSAGLVYSFYHGKEDLFEGVFAAILEYSVTEIPIDADDLPGYAVRLMEANEEHPDVARFMRWYQMERGLSPTSRSTITRTMKTKVAAVRDAQKRGTVTDRLDAGQILALVITLGCMWQDPDAWSGIVPKTRRRQTVETAVRQLVTP
jgi:AcrR family transcriptional regulator